MCKKCYHPIRKKLLPCYLLRFTMIGGALCYAYRLITHKEVEYTPPKSKLWSTDFMPTILEEDENQSKSQKEQVQEKDKDEQQEQLFLSKSWIAKPLSESDGSSTENEDDDEHFQSDVD